MKPELATDTPELHATCEIRDWPVFVHGFHKGDLYPPADLERMEANFRLLSADGAAITGEDGGPFLTANVKLGHDKQQRAKKSLGFINLGQVCRLERGGPNGTARLWLRNVPTEVGGKINAGLINGGSIEIIPSILDPRDPGRKIDGPVMTGVALLGEEQPAVKGMGRPRAVFADGTPVPPDHEVSPWLDALMEAAREEDQVPDEALIGGQSYSQHRLLFSEMVMNPELLTKLTAIGLTPEQAQQVAQLCGGQMTAPPPEPPAPPTPPPTSMSDDGITPPTPTVPVGDGSGPKTTMSDEMPPWAKEMSQQFAAVSRQFGDLTKRMGDLEAARTEEQKKEDEAKMAAFSAQVETECAKIVRKVQPEVLEKVVKPTALNILTSKSFSAETDRVKTFSEFFAGYAALPDDPRLKVAPNPQPMPSALSHAGRKLLSVVKDTNPRVVARLTSPALPTAK